MKAVLASPSMKFEKIIGKLGCISQVFRPIYHLMGISRQFCALINQSKQLIAEDTSSSDVREIQFAAKKASHQLHQCKQGYTICKSLSEEIELFRKLRNNQPIPLSTHLGHIVL